MSLAFCDAQFRKAGIQPAAPDAAAATTPPAARAAPAVRAPRASCRPSRHASARSTPGHVASSTMPSTLTGRRRDPHEHEVALPERARAALLGGRESVAIHRNADPLRRRVERHVAKQRLNRRFTVEQSPLQIAQPSRPRSPSVLEILADVNERLATARATITSSAGAGSARTSCAASIPGRTSTSRGAPSSHKTYFCRIRFIYFQ